MRAPSYDRRSKEQAGVGAAKPQCLGSQRPPMLLVPHLLGTGSHGASLDSSKCRNGLRLLTEGLHNRVTRKLETRVGGFVAIFHSVPRIPNDHMVHCFYTEVHCHFHDSVSLHSHEGGSGELGGKESWMKEEGFGHLSQVTPHQGQQGRYTSRLTALEQTLHKHRDFCLFSSLMDPLCTGGTWSTADKQEDL